MTNRAPFITAIVVLLLAVLYVTIYFVLVLPQGMTEFRVPPSGNPYFILVNYRVGAEWSHLIFWPLEQIDRKVRPGAWEKNEFLFPDSPQVRRLAWVSFDQHRELPSTGFSVLVRQKHTAPQP